MDDKDLNLSYEIKKITGLYDDLANSMERAEKGVNDFFVSVEKLETHLKEKNNGK